ncbi:MAG TPA: hypothetical protein ENH00_07005 [Actinobacteria bacterium]|nr:hypothetical protein [Actinomycetota bacterium]HDL50186.1 hypothetical protein [Actinomycetota bacterium]
MTKHANRCAWCGGALPRRKGPGRPRRYCKQSCRQQAHIARKLADARGLGADDVLVSRRDLEELQGLLYGLETALEDVAGDLAAGSDGDAYREAFEWLRATAEPLAVFWMEPKAAHIGSKLAPRADSTT